MLSVDYIVVGSGLTGATIARTLHDAGARVLVLERRAHVGGNVHDQVHPSGIRIHSYGPHYFRTGSRAIWAFATRFGSFYRFEARSKSLVDGFYENWPVSHSYVRRVAGENWKPSFTGTPTNFEEAALAVMPEIVYKKFVKGYNEKQWGVSPSQLTANLAMRFDVRSDDDPRLSRHKYQGLPVDGYAVWMQTMLAGIPVVVNCDFHSVREALPSCRLLIFTGPIDELFASCFGRLCYRGQSREHEYIADMTRAQPEGQINNPSHGSGPHIRSLEWKHFMQSRYASRIIGTVVTRETPITPSDPNQYEYPFPDAVNRALHERYRALAARLPGVLICGRLGEYRYLDMDQAIGRALHLARGILRESVSRRKAPAQIV